MIIKNYKDFENIFDGLAPEGTTWANYHYNIISTFDIETSNNTKFAWLVIWQWYINGITYVGRTMEQLQEFVEKLNSCLHFSLFVYVHNLGYEWQFIKRYFKWSEEPRKNFFMQERKPYKVTTGYITFKDSLCLSGMSLAKTTAGLDVEKAVGTWDYTKTRTPNTPLTDKEINYAVCDVVSLAKYIEMERSTWNGLQNIPMTKTGKTRKRLRLYLKEYYKDFDTSKGGKDGYNYYYRKYIMRCYPDLETFENLRRAYWGGFTHASLYNCDKVLPNVESYDISSSYPTVMIAEKFPYKFIKVNSNRADYYLNNPNYAVLCTITMRNFKSVTGWGYIPAYKCQILQNIQLDNRKVYMCNDCNGVIKLTITEIDYNIIKRVYADINGGPLDIQIDGDIYVSKKQYLPEGFTSFILEQYGKKTTLKGIDGKEEEYARAKADVNCLYGMTVTDPVRDSYIINQTEEATTVDLTAQLDKEGNAKTNAQLLKEAYREHAQQIGLYQWGVYVSAYARRNLLETILKIDNKDFIYSDTDSIKILNGGKYENIFETYNKDITTKLQNTPIGKLHPEKLEPKTIKNESKPLGVFEHEFTAGFFKVLRAKTYIYTEGGKLHCTVAGIPKERIKRYLLTKGSPFYYFTQNLIIPYQYDPETVKLTAKYIDEENTAVINGETVKSLSSTVLVPTDFSIKYDEEYSALIDYVEELQKHKIDLSFMQFKQEFIKRLHNITT